MGLDDKIKDILNIQDEESRIKAIKGLIIYTASDYSLFVSRLMANPDTKVDQISFDNYLKQKK